MKLPEIDPAHIVVLLICLFFLACFISMFQADTPAQSSLVCKNACFPFSMARYSPTDGCICQGGEKGK